MGRGPRGARHVRHDIWFRRAREEGYRARSAYKLIEIQEKYKILRKGMGVLDLGAAPGSWSQVASRFVGPSGRVLAVDLKAIAPGLPTNVFTHVGDVFDISPEIVRSLIGRSAIDALLSDMAPATSGIREVDHLRSMDLCERAVSVASALLRPGGAMALKVFEGRELKDFVDTLKPCFDTIRRIKPAGSRDVSVELFVVALGYRGPHGGKGEIPLQG